MKSSPAAPKSTRTCTRWASSWPTGLARDREAAGVPAIVRSLGPIVSFFLLTEPGHPRLNSYRDVRRHCDFANYIEFQHFMQRAGVYFHPNQFETMFLSTAHTANDIAARAGTI